MITLEGTQSFRKAGTVWRSDPFSGWFPTGIYRSMSLGTADMRRWLHRIRGTPLSLFLTLDWSLLWENKSPLDWTSRFSCCVLLALFWNTTNENPITYKSWVGQSNRIGLPHFCLTIDPSVSSVEVESVAADIVVIAVAVSASVIIVVVVVVIFVVVVVVIVAVVVVVVVVVVKEEN